MVLVLGGVVLDEAPVESRNLFHAAPHLKEAAAHVASLPPKVVTPVGLLYLHQREFAVVLPHDKNVSVLGTDDCNTCIAVILRHTGSGATCMAHVDGADQENGISPLVSRLQEVSQGYPNGRIELHLVGGYLDPRGYSERLVINLLHWFHKEPLEFDVVFACIGDMNTTVRGGQAWPMIYGVGFNVKTGEIFHATFPDKGPDIALRSARQLTGSSHLMDLYDCSLGLLRVGPYHYQPLRGVDLWLEMTDDFIVSQLSTAPEVELPHFASKIRAALKYIRDHPFPGVTVFPDNRSRYFRRDESGSWTYMRY